MPRSLDTKLTDIRALIESGDIRTYADSYGIWHAVVKRSYAHPMGVAKLATLCELIDRAPRDADIPLPRVQAVSDSDTHTLYREV